MIDSLCSIFSQHHFTRQRSSRVLKCSSAI
jgi:hypothetical protein